MAELDVTIQLNGDALTRARRRHDLARRAPAQPGRSHRHEGRLWRGHLRCMHGAGRWRSDALVHPARRAGRRRRRPDRRGALRRGRAVGAAAGVHRRGRVPVRVLHARPARLRDRAARSQPHTDARRDPPRDGGQPLPVRCVSEDRARACCARPRALASGPARADAGRDGGPVRGSLGARRARRSHRALARSRRAGGGRASRAAAHGTEARVRRGALRVRHLAAGHARGRRRALAARARTRGARPRRGTRRSRRAGRRRPGRPAAPRPRSRC